MTKTKLVTILSLALAFLYWPQAHSDMSRRIEEAALNGVTNVIEKNRVRTLFGAVINSEDTGYGKYACARVTAATINHAGLFIGRRIKGHSKTLALAVWEIEGYAHANGWMEISDESHVLPGDIVIYRKLWNLSGNCLNGDGACHVGIMTRQGLFHNHPFKQRPHLGGSGLMFFTFKKAYRHL